MQEKRFIRESEFSGQAMALIERCGLPPVPVIYDLVYRYVAGTDPALSSRIAVYLQGDNPTVEEAERILGASLRDHNADRRIARLSEQATERIEAVGEAVDTAMASAETYSNALNVAGSTFRRGMAPEDFMRLAEGMQAETRQMQSANADLRERLDASRADISTLRSDLEQVRRESEIDPLTGAFNRRHFDDALQTALTKPRGEEPLFSLIMVDIDNFKQFNDTWGHQTGDQVLRLVASTLKSGVRDEDTTARFGGEEFAAILPGSGLQGATAVADKIRDAIRSRELVKRSTNEKLGRVTASFGVATYIEGDTAESLIERADLCLYEAKRSGRDCVVGEDQLRQDQRSSPNRRSIHLRARQLFE